MRIVSLNRLHLFNMRPSRPYHAVTAYHREPGGLRRLDFFMDRVQAFAGDDDPAEYKILDIGCGNGNISIPLAAMGFQVVGMDFSDAAVKAAAQAAEEAGVMATFVVGDETAVPDNSFDIIICSEVLEHQSRPEVFLQTIKKKLTPHGLVLFSLPNGQSLEERIRRLLDRNQGGRWVKKIIKRLIGISTIQSLAQDPHKQFYSYRRLIKQLKDAGFMVVFSDNASVWFKEFFYLMGRIWMRRGSRCFHVLDAWDNVMSDYWPRKTADGWLLETRLSQAQPLAVQIIPTLELGGAEIIVTQLAELLPERGFSVAVLAHVRTGQLHKILKSKHVPCTVMERRGFLGRWKSFWNMRQWLMDVRPEVVHTHLFGGDTWGRLAARLAGLKNIVTTEHNVNPDYSRTRSLVLRLMAGFSVKYAAISKMVSVYLQDRVGVPQTKIRLIYNGLDLSKIKKRSGTLLHDIPRIIYVGRLEEQKNPELLLRALSYIKQPWQLTVVGDGSLRQKLCNLAYELRLAPRVSFLGVREDVPDLLADHDLFCFPSKWEGFGLAVIEAAAAGIPVLCSDLPVLRELLDDSQVTFVPSDDIQAWSQAVRSVLIDPATYTEKARRAAESDWQKFEQRNMAAAYAELYQEVLAEGLKSKAV